MDRSPSEKIAELEVRLIQLESRRSRIVREIDDVNADLVALRRVADRNLLSTASATSESTDPVRHGEVREIVSSAVTHMAHEFTVRDVIACLETTYPSREFDRTSVSKCLSRLAEEGTEIIEAVPGAGRRMTVYRRTQAPKEVIAA